MPNLIQRFENLLYQYFSRKYLSRILAVLLFLIFGFAFYLIYLDSIAIKDQIKDDFNQQQLILARQTSSQISLYLNNLELQLKNLEWFCSNQDRIVRGAAIKSVFELNKDMGALTIGYYDLTSEKLEIFGDCDSSLNQIVNNISGADNSSKGMNLGNLRVSRLSKSKTIIISRVSYPVRKNGRITGELFLELDISQLLKKIAGNVRSGKTGYTWVINEKGTALYHPENEFIGRNIFEARQERKPYVNFSKINEIMKKRMMKGEEGTEIYESWWHRELNGQIIKLIAFTPIKNSSLPDNGIWSVAVVAPISEVAEPIDKAYWRHFAAEAFIIFGMFLFTILMADYQRRVSASLKERVSVQEEYISSILENSMDAIIFTDESNKIKVWNKGAEKIFDYTAEEMIGKGFHGLIPSEIDADKELNFINDIVRRDGYISNYISQRVTKSGRRITVNVSKTHIASSKGETLGYSIILRDETEKIELEQRIYNTEKLASIGTLAAGVAHEINNPLAIILGYTDLLIEKFDSQSQEFMDLKLIEANANNAKKIVENLLGFARITEGLEDVIDIKSNVETVVSIIKNTLFTKKIELELEVQPNLPDVRGDVREFEQVIFNLINNSVAAMKNTKAGKIAIRAYRNGDMASIEISDTGDGIPNRVKQRIFDPFFTTKKIGEGTGLGLSLCYGIIAKYGGKISFRSISKEDAPDEESGTTFIVEMPIIKK